MVKQPVTLLFLRRDGEILLAMKKRGFGAGKWNGVGGKVDPGETIEQATIRECQEEIGVTPQDIQKVGIIDFYMTDDPDFHHNAHVYAATDWEGKPEETEEMKPQWFNESDIPYPEMWQDDVYWLPLLIAGKQFKATFWLDTNDVLHDWELEEVDEL